MKSHLANFPTRYNAINASVNNRFDFLKKKLGLRMFARKFSNIDFFIKILLLKDDELAM